MTLKDLIKLTNEEALNVLYKMKEEQGELPSDFETLYEILEDARIKKLPKDERFRLFLKSKEVWSEQYPDFKRISDVMENFRTDEMLVEYGKHSPPLSIHDRAIEIFKKCISFKVKFTKRILSHLNQHPDTLHIHYYRSGIYCISEVTVKSFLKEYQSWNFGICSLWNEIYYLKQDFFYDSGYDRSSWNFFIKYPTALKEKADKIEKLHEKIVELLNEGKELILKHEEAITFEYSTNSLEMSLYEREMEILRMRDIVNVSDEEYCYVYTLECELDVFYVGIASNPKERFEQHIRGAFADEAHLFKSKFIQKYHNKVKQNIVYEGTRKECKIFEKEYIFRFKPLGNMTEGGEG